MSQDQEQGYIEAFEQFFVEYVFPVYHYIRQDRYMTYCFYIYLMLVLIHWLTKYIKRILSRKKPPFDYTVLDDKEKTNQNLNKLETEIQEIKTFLKDLTQSSMDTQLIHQIQQQSGSIASIQQNFLKFATLQEEFQRTFLQTQTKMMTHMSKTLSQRTGSNPNQSISSIQKAELSFNQKQDSPRSQADSLHKHDQSSILSQVNNFTNQQNHKRQKSGVSKVDIITQELIQEVAMEKNGENKLLYTPQSRPKEEPKLSQKLPPQTTRATKPNKRLQSNLVLS